MIDLKGHTAFVSGSSRGIGRAIAADLAECGAEVILHGVKESAALKEAVNAIGHGALALHADLGIDVETEALIKTLQSLEKPVDILVLNSSVQSYTGIENFNDVEFVWQMKTNVESSFKLIQALAPAMCERKFGRIIFISSINQLRPASRLSLYGATKAAAANMIKAAAKDYARYNVTANTLVPGVIVTDRNREVLKNREFADALLKDIPMHRFGTAEDCSKIAAFLASDCASYITGAEIPVAGGWQL